jgi:cytochrome c oxidase subunit 2
MAPRGVNADVGNGAWWFMFWLSGAIFVGWLALFMVAMFRRRRTAATEADEERVHRRFIVGGGLVLPAIALGALFVYNLGALNALPQGGDVVIDATGYQYWWEFGYTQPEFVTANEMYIPTGTDVRVRLRTADVIHSFWVPQLSGKRDMVPGRVNELTLHAREPGRYRGACTEFCGIQHANMRFTVIAVPPDQYQAWLAHMARPAAQPRTAAERAGYGAFMDSSCASCHVVRGTPADGRAGPDLTHLASRRELGAGAVPNDRGHLGGWVVNAQALKPGNPMPPIEIAADDLPDLLTYLESLE